VIFASGRSSMLLPSKPLQSFVSLCVLSFVFQVLAVAQQSAVQPRIVQPIDETQLTLLKGNTHPLARAQYDQGAAPASLPMGRMILVLEHSSTQESAVNQLLDDQHDKNSPNYHKWLTPDEYGQQFGPADQDVQTVTNWLQTHGFQIGEVTKGKHMIEFSGTAGQVQEALHTAIHKYTVNGHEYSANSGDPSIPTALVPVVAGVESLNNFPRKPMSHIAGVVSRDKATGKVTPLQPLFTLPSSGGCGVQPADCYGVGPYDFATIYNVLPLWTAATPIDGTGQTIAIVGETNINPQDVADFRNFFGLPAANLNVILNGPDPGILTDGEETEADLDVEWSGAVAKGATIDFVVSESTETSAGIDLSALYIIENNLAPVMSESYGFCELGLGTAGNVFFSEMWQQASAQGITVLLASGDSGAAGCDSQNNAPPAPAQFGLAVSGYASTPFNVAVGGTDFDDLTNAGTYWNLTNNSTTQASAKSYIPETTWNDTCTNSVLGPNLEANCNNPQLINFVVTVGAGGGASNCVVSDGQDTSSCSAGYAKPSWQTGTGVPADGLRDMPDVSLFSASGSPSGSFYIVCEADLIIGATSCNLSDPNTEFLGVGGTSASAPSFAGVMALVNQKTTSAQGNANYVLYKMAQSKTLANGFNDVNPATVGTIAMPCATGSPNCTTATAGDAYGVLSGYSTTAGYDLATGLGSVNVENLVNNWTSVTFTSSATTLALTPMTLTHGAPVTVTIGVTGSGGPPTGAVALMGSPTNPNYGVDNFVLSGGTASGSTTLLPGGGPYNVTAHYAGDGKFGGSVSAAVPVTVNAESSKTAVELETFNSSGQLLNSNATTAAYGSPYILRVNVTNSAGACDTDAGTNNSACPVGSVAVTDASVQLETLQLNSLGYAEDQFIQLATGSHTLAGAFTPSDLSFSASASTTDTVSITQAATGITAAASATTTVPGTPVALTATVTTQSSGVAPTGTVTFFNNGTALSGTVTYTPTAGSASAPAGLVASLSVSFSSGGSESITAKYNGDSNYTASPASAAVVVNVQAFNFTASSNTLTIASPGGSANVTLTITGGTGYNGTVTFASTSCTGLPSKTTCSFNPTSVTGNGTSTLTIKTTAASTAALDPRHGFEWWMGTSTATFAGIFLLGAVPKRRRTGLLSLLVLLLAALPGCGGGGSSSTAVPGTPTGSYTVTVTAVSGTSLTLTLNVQ
jgi:subtilase family serine protease